MIQYSTHSNTPEFYATLAQVQESRNAAMYEYTRVALVCMNSERTVVKRARTISKGSPKNIKIFKTNPCSACKRNVCSSCKINQCSLCHRNSCNECWRKLIKLLYKKTCIISYCREHTHAGNSELDKQFHANYVTEKPSKWMQLNLCSSCWENLLMHAKVSAVHVRKIRKWIEKKHRKYCKCKRYFWNAWTRNSNIVCQGNQWYECKEAGKLMQENCMQWMQENFYSEYKVTPARSAR